IIARNPDVTRVVAFLGGGRGGGAFMQVSLKPKAQRSLSSPDALIGSPSTSLEIIGRLRPRLARVTRASLFLNPVQDLRIGGRQSNASFQYPLKADNLSDLRRWATRLTNAMQEQPVLEDVNSDQEDHGLESFITVNYDDARRLGLTS